MSRIRKEACTAPLESLQLSREAEGVQMGLRRALTKDDRAAVLGEQTRMEMLTLAHLVPPVATFMQSLVDHYAAATGRRPCWSPILRALSIPDVAAAALRTGFSLALKTTERQKAVGALGRTLENLWVLKTLRDGATTGRQKDKIRGLTRDRKTIRARLQAIEKAADDAGLEPWTDIQTIKMGAPLLSALLSTGIFAETNAYSKRLKDTIIVFGLSEDGQKMAREVQELGLLARPTFRPMLTPPAPWKGLRTGCYKDPAVARQVRLIRIDSGEKAHLKVLQQAVKDGSLAPVMEAVNIIQAVPLRIRKDVAALRDWVWETGVELEDTLPLRKPVEVPQVPGDPQEATPRFWAGFSRAKRVNAGIGPNVLAYNAVTAEARSLEVHEEFYLPHSMDFRGRVYPVPSFSHHNGDATKALMEFADGCKLGESGLQWLKVHVANTGDFEKVSKRSFDGRLDWVDDNMLLIRALASNPCHPDNVKVLQEADKPFSFYAACRELVAALDNPEGPAEFISHLPVALDGSNSGVQHYSAMMAAEEGRYVNLTPGETPEDLYARVAEEVSKVAQRCFTTGRRLMALKGTTWGRDDVLEYIEALGQALKEIDGLVEAKELRLDAPCKGRIARLKKRRGLLCGMLWADTGISRSTVKRNVMTYGYSSQAFGMGQQIRTDYMEPLALQVLKGDLPRHPFGHDDGKAAAIWLGAAVYRAVEAVLPRVAAAMRWLKSTAGALAHEGHGVLMRTPLGFPMLMREVEFEGAHVEIHLLDKTVPLLEATKRDVVVGDSVLRRVQCYARANTTDHVVKHAQMSGVAPNVIHALDGCHLQMSVRTMAALGVPNLLVIHDSFATHAGNVQVLSQVLRETLLDLYGGDYSPLQNIVDNARGVMSDAGFSNIKKIPERGELDLSGILEADYTFA